MFKLQFWSLLQKQSLGTSGITLGDLDGNNTNLNHISTKYSIGKTALVAVRFTIPYGN